MGKMQHWEALLEEVLNKKIEKSVGSKASSVQSEVADKKIKKIFLGVQFRDIYFTNREAEVMVQLLQGKTLGAVANMLQLSPRTVEFYVKNMKAKLACRTKSDLIGKVFSSDFIANVDFIANLKKE